MSSIPFRTTVGPPFQATKWVKYPLLIEIDEMRSLLSNLKKFWILQMRGVVPLGQEQIDQDDFLQIYSEYLSTLKRGEIPDEDLFRACFSSAFTATLESVYGVKINEKNCLMKALQPVIQLQVHRFDYSYADHTFRSMVLGNGGIEWGIQFGYPFLYKNEELEVLSVTNRLKFPNTALFKQFQQWMRSQTIATPFIVEGKEVNVPIRLGKQCLKWINQHPQLIAKGLKIRLSTNSD